MRGCLSYPPSYVVSAITMDIAADIQTYILWVGVGSWKFSKCLQNENKETKATIVLPTSILMKIVD